MLDTILKLDPEQITQWVAVLIALVTLIKSAREKDRSDKWAYIKAIVPEAHNLAQKIATATRHTKKDDEFVAQVDKLLKAIGWSVKPAEVAAIKALGEGYHQDFKASVSAEKNLIELGMLSPESESSEPEK